MAFRLVYFSLPAHGHINPTLPLAAELVRRGARMDYYATEEFRAAVESTGAKFLPYAGAFAMPRQGVGPFGQLTTTIEALLDLTGVVLDHHLDEARALAPASVMHDSFSPWGRFAARLLGVPAVVSVPSILVNREIDARYGGRPEALRDDRGLTPEWLAAMRARCAAFTDRYGLPALESPAELLQSYGDLNLVYTSRLFQPLADSFEAARFQFVGPSIAPRSHAPAFPFQALDGRPLVYVSLGSVYADRAPFFRTCLEALAGGPWQVVMSVGRNFADGMPGPVPDNFFIQPFVPQLEILARAAVFVTHGGMNSVNEALYHGVPLIAAPQGSDQFWIARRAAELGAALVLDATVLDARGLRDAVARVLSDRSYAEAAGRVGESLRSAGGAVRAVDAIEAFQEARGI